VRKLDIGNLEKRFSRFGKYILVVVESTDGQKAYPVTNIAYSRGFVVIQSDTTNPVILSEGDPSYPRKR